MSDPTEAKSSSGSAAGIIAAGIFTSRIMGFIREAATAYFFGVGAHADVLRTALRMPNVLQNLLGEGTISAAFIPIYSRMVEEGRARDAGRFAGAIFGLLCAVVSVLVLAGILLAEPIVAVLTPGFLDDAARVAAGELAVNRYALTVRAVRIIFPMTGILVLFAWTLGVLNSHRRFFLPYFAPVLWNVAIIAALFGGAYVLFDDPLDIETLAGLPVDALTRLLFIAFFGALVGGVLQFLVSLPTTLRLLEGFRPSLSTRVAGVRESMRAFGPVVAGRGVYQISTYLDLFLASLLVAGAVSALGYAQMLYVLPISLFGMSVAASELPELSRLEESQLASFMARIRRSLRQILFLTVPTAVGYLAFGFLIVSALLRHGGFGLNDTWLVYTVLAGYTLGLLATTLSRLLQNAFYALNDTKTPAKIAVLRVVVSTAIAVPTMFYLDRFAVSEVLGFEPPGDQLLRFGAVGLTVGASVGAWVELWRLGAALRSRTETFRLPWAPLLRMVGLAVVAALAGVLVWWLLPAWPAIPLTAIVVGLFGLLYLALSHVTGAPEMEAWAGRFLDRLRPRGD